MKIRYRLAFQFSVIVACILLVFSISIYFFSVKIRNEEFVRRIKNRAATIANMLIDIREVDSTLLEKINRRTITLLFRENIEIYTLDGKLLYEYQENLGMKKYWKKENLEEIRKKGEIVEKIDHRYVVDFLYPRDKPGLIVKASAFDEYGHIQLDNLKLILIAGFLICLIFTIFSSILYAGEALRPISKFIQQIGMIKASSLDKRVDEGGGKDEMSMLAIHFNQLLDRLEKSFEMQRGYVSNVSHEMRTPLTSMNGQIEVTLLKKRSVDEYEDVLKSIHGDILNLIRLSNGFLELAETSIENGNQSLQKVRIDEILYLAKDEVKKRCPGLSVDIRFNDPIEDENMLIISGNQYLLKILFTNLMDNAYKFSDNKKLRVKIKTGAGNITMDFLNTGTVIPHSDLENIMQPFYRANNGVGVKGHGVGLAIVNKIVQMHNGQISVTSEAEKGTNFCVSFPV